MHNTVARLLALLVLTAGGVVATQAPAAAYDRDCSDFSTQAQAPQPFAGTTGTQAVRRNTGTVVKVVDGDTVKVRLRGVGVRSIRIIGIDTPEKYGRTECGAAQASARMRRLAPVGSRVTVVSDPSQALTDRYGRFLRYVHRGRIDVGRAQVRTGHAKVYVYNRKPFRRTGDYRTAERTAKAQRRGLWGTCWRR